MDVFLNILFWILAAFLILLVLVLFAKVKLVFKFNKQKGEDAVVSLQIILFGGLIKKNISLGAKNEKSDTKEKKEEKELKFFDKVKKYYSDFLKYKKVYNENSKRIRKAIYAERIHLNLNFGLGDAAKTGIATGGVWAGVYNVIAFVSKIIRIREPKINVTPEYNELMCELKGECIIAARPVNLITAALGLYKSYKKIIKNK